MSRPARSSCACGTAAPSVTVAAAGAAHPGGRRLRPQVTRRRSSASSAAMGCWWTARPGRTRSAQLRVRCTAGVTHIRLRRRQRRRTGHRSHHLVGAGRERRRRAGCWPRPRYLGMPVRDGAAEPVRLRLLGPRPVRLRAGSASRPAPHHLQQWQAGRHVPRSRARPGDLVFFHGGGHVGIYLGGGRFIHAPTPAPWCGSSRWAAGTRAPTTAPSAWASSSRCSSCLTNASASGA